jgi:hypothetical protein
MRNKEAIEKIARAICRAKHIDPDRLCYPGMPVRMDGDRYHLAGSRPDETPSPAWTFYYVEASIALECAIDVVKSDE